jgi:hypothetical protein
VKNPSESGLYRAVVEIPRSRGSLGVTCFEFRAPLSSFGGVPGQKEQKDEYPTDIQIDHITFSHNATGKPIGEPN